MPYSITTSKERLSPYILVKNPDGLYYKKDELTKNKAGDLVNSKNEVMVASPTSPNLYVPAKKLAQHILG